MTIFQQAWAAAISAQYSTFGEMVQYVPLVLDPVMVRAIWDDGEDMMAANPGLQAIATVQLDALPEFPTKFARIVRCGKTYEIRDDPKDRLDKYGGVRLLLRLV